VEAVQLPADAGALEGEADGTAVEEEALGLGALAAPGMGLGALAAPGMGIFE